MINPTGTDPQRLPKGGVHLPPSESDVQTPMDKPGFVKPGDGRNRDTSGMDAMPGFENLKSYKSTDPDSPRTDYGQDTYRPANKTSGSSIGCD